MAKITSSVFFAVLLGLFLHMASAHAQYVRTCVSARGDDANTCHCSQPCRTFQRAHDQTLDQGEVTVLDPGGYGPVTISKSISSVNDGVGEASIQVSGGGVGITVSAGAAAYVNLRGITIQGVDTVCCGTGLVFNSGFSLTMTNCVVRNIVGTGIFFRPTASTNLSLSNTLVADNGGNGIIVFPTGSLTVKAEFNRVEAYNNSGNGIFVDAEAMFVGSLNATIVESVAHNNSLYGFAVTAQAGNPLTNLMVVRSVTANNATGLLANGQNATLRIGESTVTGNTTSWSTTFGGVLRSYGDNNIDGNADANPAPTTIVKK